MLGVFLALCGSYFSCRHSYEPTLIAELEGLGVGARMVHPGLVHAASHSGVAIDPTYALQALPECSQVRGETTKALAAAALAAVVGSRPSLDAAGRGALKVHALVPDLCKGAPKPRMLPRAERVAEALAAGLRKRFKAARPAAAGAEPPADDRWLVQLLLLSPTEAAVSVSRCAPCGPGGSWPNWRRAGGLHARALLPKEKMWTGPMPSSAYRKLLEALDCMEVDAVRGTAVDLGACPGSWTRALRLLGCERVHAVDRQTLAPECVADPKITFVEGDAFTFEPPEPVEWLVSDVIAYPERVVTLLDAWCGQKRATAFVVTMKFKGDEPNLEALAEALDVAATHGYRGRAKHFFSNKNEVTIMLALASDSESESRSPPRQAGH